MKRFELSRLLNPQVIALAGVLLLNWLLFPGFFKVTGRTAASSAASSTC